MFRVDFLDVTLACEDDQQIGTHKVILLASSPLDIKMGFQLQVNSTTKWTQLQSGLTTKWTQYKWNQQMESTNGTLQSGINYKVTDWNSQEGVCGYPCLECTIPEAYISMEGATKWTNCL